MPKFVKVKHIQGYESWINPDLVVEVATYDPNGPISTIYLSGGWGREIAGTKEDVVRLLQS